MPGAGTRRSMQELPELLGQKHSKYNIWQALKSLEIPERQKFTVKILFAQIANIFVRFITSPGQLYNAKNAKRI